MKLFVAQTGDIFHKNDTCFNEANLGEILIIPVFQQGFGSLNEYTMIGCNTLKKTTQISVKNFDNMSKHFLTEIIHDTYTKLYNTKVDKITGWFDILISKDLDWQIPANMFEDIEELIDKAKCFADGQQVGLSGRTFYGF
jgi:hypothetical protein